MDLQIQSFLEELEGVITELHEQQCLKAQKVAQQHLPHLTSEDLLNPDNYAEIISNPNFMYEDGMAAGILAAKMALRAHFKANL